MKTWTIVVIAIVVGIAGFFGGMYYSNSQRAALRNSFAGGQFQGQNGQGFRNRNGANRPVVGEILSQDSNTITVKMQDGSSKIVILSGTTIYNKTATAAKTDLKVGDRVGVFGTTNSDGSVTAQNVQLNPMFRTNNTGGAGTPPPAQ